MISFIFNTFKIKIDYKKSKNYKEWAYFYCNACLSHKTIVSAIAIHHAGEDEHGADDTFDHNRSTELSSMIKISAYLTRIHLYFNFVK